MKFLVDSDEYRAWHEVGHAVICLLLGGDVRFIEFLDGTGRGFAKTRCLIPPEINQSVACAGFAAEFFVLKNGLAEQAPSDVRPINQVLFHNAYEDREDFQGPNPADVPRRPAAGSHEPAPDCERAFSSARSHRPDDRGGAANRARWIPPRIQRTRFIAGFIRKLVPRGR